MHFALKRRKTVIINLPCHLTVNFISSDDFRVYSVSLHNAPCVQQRSHWKAYNTVRA